MRFDRYMLAVGAVLMLAGGTVVTAAPAGATFGGAGATNGDILFDSTVCGTNGAYTLIYVNPLATLPSSGCSGTPTDWSHNQQSLSGDDYEPFYSADTNTVYFESDRATVPANGGSAIFSVPSVFSGTGNDPGGVTQVTNPSASQADYAPAVSADGSKLSFVRCLPAGCQLWTKPLVPPGAEAAEATDFPLANPVQSNTTGTTYGDRPEFNPVNGGELLYECQVTIGGTQYGHICLHPLGTSGHDVDLSAQSEANGTPWAGHTSPWSHTDENADWRYDGTAIIYDSNGGLTSGGTGSPVPASGGVVFSMAYNDATKTASSANPVSANSPGQGTEYQPIFSPDGTQYAWAHVQSGSYIDAFGSKFNGGTGTEVVSPTPRGHSSQPTWEGTVPQAALPEAPYAVLLPGAGLALAGLLLVVRRRRRATA